MNELIYRIALKYAAAGISVLPADLKSKKPYNNMKWKIYQQVIMSVELINELFAMDDVQLSVICGKVSGHLEIIDIDNHFGDSDKMFAAYKELIDNTAVGLWEKLTIERTQRGGYHLFYRCPEGIEKNQKLASRMKPDGKEADVLIETRGEGGYALVSPSSGYELIQGMISKTQIITAEERTILLNCARSFNEVEEAAFNTNSQKTNEDGLKPGDDFNQRGDCLPYLEKHNYKIWGNGDKKFIIRPGKNEGVSATYNFVKDKLYVFSTNCYPFESLRSYSKFAVVAMLEFNGDFQQCAKDLFKMGYGVNGQQKEKKSSGESETKPNSEPVCKLTELGNSERFIKQFGDISRYNHTSGNWHIWNGCKWEPDLTRSILTYAKQTVRNMYKEIADIEDGDIRKQMPAFIRSSETRAKLENMLFLSTNELGVLNSDFDKQLHFINLLNGTYDLRQNVLLPHSAKNLLSKSFNATYDPNATCYCWESFLNTIFNYDYELIKFVQRAVGLSLCGEHLEEKLFFAYGTGKNGKSVFFNVLRMIFGDYFQKAPTEMLLMKFNDSIPNDIARLPGARIVVAEELPENRSLDENKIKNLTGGDMITARFLHKEFFDFSPAYSLWIYGNHKPNIKGTDEGIWRRICLIPFLVTIPEDQRRPHSELMSEFEDEKAGILNWCIQGWIDYKNEGLNPPAIVQEYTKEYKSEQDHISDFIADQCETKSIGRVKKADLLQSYYTWCKSNNEYPLKRGIFYKRIEARDGVHSDSGTDNVKYFVGIELRTVYNVMYN